MRDLERLLGNDVVCLIYRKLHAMCTAEVVTQYHGQVRTQCHGRVPSTDQHFYVNLSWGYMHTKAYNYRVLGLDYRLHVHDKYCQPVAQLPKNY